MIEATASQQATARVDDTYGGDGWTELAQLGKFPDFRGSLVGFGPDLI